MARGTHTGRPLGTTAAVAARFPDMVAARAALEALEHVGVDGDDLELLGAPVDVARIPSDPKPTDRRTARHIGGRLARGVEIGAAAGAVLGLLMGVLVVTVTDATSSRGGLVLALVIAGLGLGATVGVFVSFERSVGLSDDWSLTFEDAPAGPVWVAVYSRRTTTTDRAARELARLHPLELRRDAESLSSG